MLRNRRRPRYGTPVCAVISVLLLLLSVSLLYISLNNATSSSSSSEQYELNPLLTDSADLDFLSHDDRIDLADEDSPLRDDNDPLSTPDDDDDDDDDSSTLPGSTSDSIYFFDHVAGVVRRAYRRRAIEDWEDYVQFQEQLGFHDRDLDGTIVFASDDVVVEDRIRNTLLQLHKVEDAFLLKGSILREGWGDWFDKKTDFLRKDKMLKSNLEGLNPLNNPMLQDPDGPGVTGYTRGDKIVIKGIMNGFKKEGSLPEKPLSRAPDLEAKIESRREGRGFGGTGNLDTSRRTEIKRAERRTLDDSSNLNNKVHVGTKNTENQVAVTGDKLRENSSEQGKLKNEFSGELHADGKRWGYYPGLDGSLSFSNFMDLFFKGNCSVRVFMVWNSPTWGYGVRHKRGLESVLFHHPDACVVVFSETIELNFFSEFVEEGFKVAVVMPNLDELLKDTPTHIFASVWYEWKQTKYYPVHYSELIRLAVLYKYGGVYFDSDIIVLKPISSLINTVGLEDEQDGSTLNGAVMASDKHSHFIMECLKEFYASYDDTNLRWNGAHLLSRVAGNLSSSRNHANKVPDLTLLPQTVSFPINRIEIPRYFAAPKTEIEKIEQDIFFKKILREYTTLHLWNSITSALIPEPNSLLARVLNKHCIHCSDVL